MPGMGAAELDEHEIYPVHEEDNRPRRPSHERQSRLLLTVLQPRLHNHWVFRDVCVYWERERYTRYCSPDVLVARGNGKRFEHDVFLSWSDGPALLAIDIAYKSPLQRDEGPMISRYLQEVGIKEYLYFWPQREPRPWRVKLWRLVKGVPSEVAPNALGRWESETLGIEFGVTEDGQLRAYERSGELIPGIKEWREQTESSLHVQVEQRQRAEQERRRANEIEQEIARLREQLRNVRGEDS